MYNFLKNKLLPTTGFKYYFGQQLHELNKSLYLIFLEVLFYAQ